ncbi:hypothetical protein MVEN_00883900 [Mycena venus]|uniref:Uncharacterized protein n=1 Tax=Mycena venus TaxID=2733690 RepID=A0A8H6YEP4_9AGAR|nr:hypothetical protein MVEN_00883900 [Mycena venus]
MVKTSADKSAEDASEKAKTSKASTSVQLKMKELQITTDPPPGFELLSLKHKAAQAQPAEDSDDDDESSVLSTPPPSTKPLSGELDDEVDVEEKNLLRSPGGNGKFDVQPEVLLKIIGLGEASQEVPIPGVNILTSQTSGGSLVHQTALAELLPALIENHTPMKARGGRFMRLGLHSGEERSWMDVGSVEQHANKMPIKALAFGPAKFLEVKPTGKGYYTADIFYDPGESASAVPAQPAPAEAGPSQIHFTGSGSDKPFEIAQVRAKEATENQAGNMKRLHEFLLEKANVDLETYPHATADTMAEALLQYNKYEEVLQVFKPWANKKGYDVPMSSPKFPGQHFTKRQIQDALVVKPATINNISLYFERKRLRHTPEAFHWFKDNSETNGDMYNTMAPVDWNEELAKNERRALREERKRRREEDSGSDESDEESDPAPKKKKSKGKGKAVEKKKKHSKKGYDSDNLD